MRLPSLWLVVVLLAVSLSACSQRSPKTSDAPKALPQGTHFTTPQLSISSPDSAAAITETPDRGETQSALPVKEISIGATAHSPEKPFEPKLPTARMFLCGPFGPDLGDDRVLIGFYQNVFVARVIEVNGPAPGLLAGVLPYTRFLVHVIENIKGDLQGRVHVDQVGGMHRGVMYEVARDGGGTAPQLIPGKTYIMATLSDDDNPTPVPKLGSHPQACTLLDEVTNEIPDVTAFLKHPKVVKLKAAALNPVQSPYK